MPLFWQAARINMAKDCDPQKRHDPNDLIRLFNGCFAKTYNTRLLFGEDEPIYLPADKNRDYHAIYFAHGFFASALHESAHWLIAGSSRRQLVDFGYWYEPDGRTAAQQALFQQVEVKPQAMEWILTQATGHSFRVSVDNLNGAEADTQAFKLAVHQQVQQYCQQGISLRVETFRNALCQFYGTEPRLLGDDFLVTTC
jgi:elongation factor P hydroxylase